MIIDKNYNGIIETDSMYIINTDITLTVLEDDPHYYIAMLEKCLFGMA